MRRSYQSPSSSPTRKRRRLSSPSIEAQFSLPSQEELDELDAIEIRLSQSYEKSSSDDADQNINDLSLQNDPANPFVTEASNSAIPAPAMSGFTSASALHNIASSSMPNSQESEPWSTPEPPPEKDFSVWFGGSAEVTPGFASASFLSAKAVVDPEVLPITFQTASKGVIVPSSAALEKAKQKMQQWQSNEGPETPASNSKPDEVVASFKSVSSLASFSRPVLRPVENSSPTTSIDTSYTSSPSFSSPLLDRVQGNNNSKQFKSPVQSGSSNHSSPLNPNNRTPASGFSSARAQHPLASTPITANTSTPTRPTPQGISSFSTPLRSETGQGTSSFASPLSATGFASSSSAFKTPLRATANTPKGKGSSTRGFVTPFKPGMRPGEAGRKILEQTKKADTIVVPTMAKGAGAASSKRIIVPSGKQPTKWFDLTVPKDRKTLLSSGLLPGQYTKDELDDMGIDAGDMRTVTPTLAVYYSFYDRPILTQMSSPPPYPVNHPIERNVESALHQLKLKNCTLATKAWVDNHWGLILWKLAGMVTLDPESEANEDTRRWCWPEVIRQLLYRYERELNRGVRPPLRVIVSQDVPASGPMVLCVSDVIWPKEAPEDGTQRHPELEVTDGWYRLRARIDEPLARAVRKGTLCTGMKIAIAGAKLWTERKDAAEILEVNTSVKLIINGNGSHLAPWHEKLGFKKACPIATTHSLTADGGIVPAMDLLILEVFPITYIEFVEEDGKRVAQPMRSAHEERQECDKWTRRREYQAAKLHEVYEKKQNRYLSYADRLEMKASANFKPGEDGPPDHIDSLYDQLEDSAEAAVLLGRIGANDAGHLAQYIRKEVETEQERVSGEIEQELNQLLPPRLVFSARMLLAQDAQSRRHPIHRKVQLTVWDVTRLNLTDGKPPGYFEGGQRFLITQLHPTHHSSWMRHEKDDQIFLCTKSMSVFTKIKA